jgi:hypothetical protein
MSSACLARYLSDVSVHMITFQCCKFCVHFSGRLRVFSTQCPVCSSDETEHHIGHIRIGFRCTSALQQAAKAFLAAPSGRSVSKKERQPGITGAARINGAVLPLIDESEEGRSDIAHSSPSTALPAPECSMRDLDQTGTASNASPAEQTLVKHLYRMTAPWPSDDAKHIVISIHTARLLGDWAQLGKSCSSLQVFWNLLDSLVPAELESVQGALCGAEVHFSETIVYDVSSSSAAHQQARVWHMPWCFQCFGVLVTKHLASFALGICDLFSVWDLQCPSLATMSPLRGSCNVFESLCLLMLAFSCTASTASVGYLGRNISSKNTQMRKKLSLPQRCVAEVLTVNTFLSYPHSGNFISKSW